MFHIKGLFQRVISNDPPCIDIDVEDIVVFLAFKLFCSKNAHISLYRENTIETVCFSQHFKH